MKEQNLHKAQNNNFSPDVYPGFLITKQIPIPELQCELIELVHKKSGANIMHIANSDPENLFCLSFRTHPESSNGVAHILEHAVLCGSKKFPVKDPFFAMNMRSLNTFMNALTGNDFTCYPAASQVEQDFYNLLEVYLDAVFHPTLDELSFAQEGHRLEFATIDDPTSLLEFKGVVFNEMKGSLASPTTRLFEAVNKELFPGSPYGYNSGGDPKEITYLTYQELKNFYQKYYHPSQCLFFFYGSIPLEKHLVFLEKHLLSSVQRQEPLPRIPPQTRLINPVRKELYFPISEEEEDIEHKTQLAFAWLTCSLLDNLTLLGLCVLDIILMNTDASYLKHALLRSGLIAQASSMFDTESCEAPYILIIKGCQSHKADEIEAIIRNLFLQLIENGIPNEKIDSALHQLELARSEITGDHAPFGLSLFMRAGLPWQHGGNAEDALRIHSLFDELKNKLLENPQYLQELLSKYFLTNQHFVRIEMHPSKELTQKENEEEKERLETLRSMLSEKQKEEIIIRAKKLIEFQEAQEHANLDVLPKISLRDVPKKARDIHLTRQNHGSLEVFHHDVFTNQISYVDLVFPIAKTHEKDLWLLRLFSVLLPQLGSGGRSYNENLEYMQKHTGGIGSGIFLNIQAENPHVYNPSFHIRGKSLFEKQNRLLSLIFDCTQTLDVTNVKRLKELIRKHFTNLQTTLNQSSLKYAVSLSCRHLGEPSLLSEAFHGLEYYYKIKQLIEHFDELSEQLIQDLERIKNHVLLTTGAHLVMTSSTEQLIKAIEGGFEGLQEIPQIPFTPWKLDHKNYEAQNQGRIIASPVANTCVAFKTISYIHKDSSSLWLASNIFENKVLHKRIREQGGAYGSGAVNNAMSGLFYFYSFRDPHITTTVQAFKESLEHVASGKFTNEDLESAQLESMQTLDSPIAPGSRAEVAYGWWRSGKSFEMRQAHRNALLSTTKKEVQQAVEKHLLPQYDKGCLVSFATKELLEKENKKLKELELPTMHIRKL